MADSVRTQIIATVKTALAAVTISNGYAFDIKRVERYRISGHNFNEFPSATLVMLEERLSNEVYPVSISTMTVLIDVWEKLADSEALDEKLDVIEKELQKALMADVHWNNKAHSTEIKFVRYGQHEEDPLGVMHMEVDITYSFKADNPEVQK